MPSINKSNSKESNQKIDEESLKPTVEQKMEENVKVRSTAEPIAQQGVELRSTEVLKEQIDEELSTDIKSPVADVVAPLADGESAGSKSQMTQSKAADTVPEVLSNKNYITKGKTYKSNKSTVKKSNEKNVPKTAPNKKNPKLSNKFQKPKKSVKPIESTDTKDQKAQATERSARQKIAPKKPQKDSLDQKKLKEKQLEQRGTALSATVDDKDDVASVESGFSEVHLLTSIDAHPSNKSSTIKDKKQRISRTIAKKALLKKPPEQKPEEGVAQLKTIKSSLSSKSLHAKKSSLRRDTPKPSIKEIQSRSSALKKFSTLKAIDTAAQMLRKESILFKTSRFQLPRKSTRKLYKLKAQTITAKARSGSIQSAHSIKSAQSVESNDSVRLERTGGHLMKLRKSDHSINSTELDVDNLASQLLKGNEVDEVDEQESDFETGSEESIEEGKDKIDRLKREFKKTSTLLERSFLPTADFFANLGDLPDIENISEDMSLIELDTQLVPQQSVVRAGDIGKFVDPLTGADISSTSSSSVSITHVPTEQDLKVVSSIDQQESAVDLLEEVPIEEDADLVALRTEVDDEVTKEKRDEVTFRSWRHLSTMKRPSFAEEFNQADYDVYIQKLTNVVRDFLNQLATSVVNQVEQGDPAKLINSSLDKNKIMNELDESYRKLEHARKENMFLNKAVTEFVRRKGDYRSLQPDPPEKVPHLIAKEKELQIRLRNLIQREAELNNVCELRRSNLNAEIAEMERTSTQSLDDMEKMMKNVLCWDRFHGLNEVVTRSFKQMAIVREEISSQRLALIGVLHTLTRIKEKEDKLEQIGEGLKLSSFEVLQAETTALGEKLEEKQQELNQLHFRRNKKVHQMTHLMEYQLMLKDTLAIKESCLRDLQQEKREARDELNKEKVKQRVIHDEIMAAQHESGLAGKPALLFDYDNTEEDLIQARSRVDKLRQKHAQLEALCSRLENRYSRVSGV